MDEDKKAILGQSMEYVSRMVRLEKRGIVPVVVPDTVLALERIAKALEEIERHH